MLSAKFLAAMMLTVLAGCACRQPAEPLTADKLWRTLDCSHGGRFALVYEPPVMKRDLIRIFLHFGVDTSAPKIGKIYGGDVVYGCMSEGAWRITPYLWDTLRQGVLPAPEFQIKSNKPVYLVVNGREMKQVSLESFEQGVKNDMCAANTVTDVSDEIRRVIHQNKSP